MDVYNETKIGKMVAWAGDHFIYEYGENEIIKFSKFDFLMGKKNALAKFYNDYNLCKQYFGNYILDTEICYSKNGRRIAKIQRRLTGHLLTLKDLDDEYIRSQLREILQSYDRMAQSKLPFIDLIGQKGVWKKCIGNIFVTADKKLVIFDATLFKVSEFRVWQRPIIFLLLQLGRQIQKYRLKQFRLSI